MSAAYGCCCLLVRLLNLHSCQPSHTAHVVCRPALPLRSRLRCTGASDQHTQLQQTSKQLQDRKQQLARLQAAAEPEKL